MADKPPLVSYFSDAQTPDLDTYFTPQKNPATQSLDLSQVPGMALENLGPSAQRFGSNIYQAARHPIETGKNIARLGMGVGEKLGISPTTGHQQYADAAWAELVNRYGGWENLKRTMATDPVGFAADISSVFTGGDTLLMRSVPMLGKIGRATDPINLATKAVTTGGKVAKEAIGNIGTGSGAAAIDEAARAGFAGGRPGKTFLENMRGPEGKGAGIVARARAAFAQVAAERSNDYQRAMAAFGHRANKPLSFDEIDAAIKRAADVGKFEGKSIAKIGGEEELSAAEQMLVAVKKNVDSWKLDPTPNIRSAAGFDKLKQLIGDKIDWLGKPSAANKVAQDIYHAVRDTIVKQDPHYAEIMKDYHEASDLLMELEKTLSLGKRASEDTALRKLLSTTRSGVNTNFGRRADLAKILNKYDPTLMPSLAGQALAGWTPHGLVGKGVAGTIGAGAAFGHSPAAALGLPFTSPRLVGETAYKVGQGARKVSDVTPDIVKRLVGKIPPDMLSQVLLLMRGAGAAGAPQ